jgi:hypothetical protein
MSLETKGIKLPGAFVIDPASRRVSIPLHGQKRKYKNQRQSSLSSQKSPVYDASRRKTQRVKSHRLTENPLSLGSYSPENGDRAFAHSSGEGETLKDKLEYQLKKENDIPEDQLFSCFCYYLRKGKPNRGSFWASVIERRGLVHQLWKCMCIFSFRDVGWGYPEAACYTYDYYILWRNEMSRYSKEIKLAIRSCLLEEASAMEGSKQEVQQRVVDWWKGLDPKDQHARLSRVRVPFASIAENITETPCSCVFPVEDEYTEPGWFMKHLYNARHYIVSVVHYLSVIPKSSISFSISFYRSLRSEGGLKEEDWTCAKLSHPYLEHELYTGLRKGLPEAVSQACLCLCSSIVFRDEERSTRITELFISWKLENIFWDCLFIICGRPTSEYNWIIPYLNKYHDAWKLSNNWKSYFLEGCSTAMYSAVLLFVRGLPKRNKDTIIISPQNVRYSRDYVSMYYGTHMPAPKDLSFIFDEESKYREKKETIQKHYDDDIYEENDEEEEEGEDGYEDDEKYGYEDDEEYGYDNEDDDEDVLREDEDEEEFPLFSSLERNFSGIPITSLDQPFGSTGTHDYRNLNRLHKRHSAYQKTDLSISYPRSTQGTTSVNEESGDDYSPLSGRVPIEMASVNWSTCQGQKLCMNYKQAFTNSECGDNQAVVFDRYKKFIEAQLHKQLRKVVGFRRREQMNGNRMSLSECEVDGGASGIFQEASAIAYGTHSIINESEVLNNILFRDRLLYNVTDEEIERTMEDAILLYRKTCGAVKYFDMINWYDPAIPMIYRSLGDIILKLEITFPKLGRSALENRSVVKSVPKSDVGYMGDIKDERFSDVCQEEGDANYLKPHISSNENFAEKGENEQDEFAEKEEEEEEEDEYVIKHTIRDFSLPPVDRLALKMETHVSFFDNNEWLEALEQYYQHYRKRNALPEDPCDIVCGGSQEEKPFPQNPPADVKYYGNIPDDLPEYSDVSEPSEFSESSLSSEIVHTMEGLGL